MLTLKQRALRSEMRILYLLNKHRNRDKDHVLYTLIYDNHCIKDSGYDSISVRLEIMSLEDKRDRVKR